MFKTKTNKTNKSAFTLIELLVVIAIIGILATLAVVALQNARKNARDAKRIADIKQIQTALELYFNDAGEYPSEITSTIAYNGNVYMTSYPSAPNTPDGDCSETQNNYIYTSNDSSTYTISFCIGSGISNLSAGSKVAAPDGIFSSQCGEYTVTFTYKGSSITYGTVLNPVTGECWLDRNLGADRIATAYNDADAYGDLFQWGRLDDGHQNRTSSTSTTNSLSDIPGHNNFIIETNSPYDWRDPQNNNLWQGVDGINNPCPTGFRIPTEAEWIAEKSSWSSDNSAGAFASPLKLTVGGGRFYDSGSPFNVGTYGHYWTSSIIGTSLYYLNFRTFSSIGNYFRAGGLTVRCIRD